MQVQQTFGKDSVNFANFHVVSSEKPRVRHATCSIMILSTMTLGIIMLSIITPSLTVLSTMIPVK